MSKAAHSLALELIGRQPENKHSSRIIALLKQDGRKSARIDDLCLSLDVKCREFEQARHRGWGYEDLHMGVIAILEELAQLGEIWISQHRNILEAMRRDTYYDVESGRGYMTAASFGEPIRISYDEERELMRVEMSAMLPFTLVKGANYFHDKIEYHMAQFDEQWRSKHGVYLSLSPVAIVFAHHYDRRRIRLNYVRDYDNLERKCIINALQVCRLFSDNPTKMIDMNMAVADERTFTEIFITKVGRFPELIQSLDFTIYQSNTEAKPSHIHNQDGFT